MPDYELSSDQAPAAEPLELDPFEMDWPWPTRVPAPESSGLVAEPDAPSVDR